MAVPVTALAVILISFAGPLGNAPAWEKRTELLDVASKFVAVGGELAQKAGFPANRVVFYVYGEPAIFYHISAQNRLAGPIGHLKFAEPEAETVPTPVFLITGPHAKNSELFHEQWEKRGDAFIEVTSIETDASLFVELNETSRDEADPSREYVLYQLQNSASCP